jgi:pimeloyl-ACP methyl ester carboxylesterase
MVPTIMRSATTSGIDETGGSLVSAAVRRRAASRPPRGGAAAAAVLSLALPLLAGCASPTLPDGRGTGSSDRTTRAPAADVARAVDIGGGRTIYLTCTGSGSPTIVLVSGLGERADNWSVTADPGRDDQAVYPQAARMSRVCAYDRPGTETMTANGREASRSSSVPQPTTGTAAAADLDAVLTAAGEPGPFVLVGHSYGGDIIRLYAAAHPGDVAGLVLVDALSEDLPERLTAQQTANLEKLNSPTTQGRPPGAEEFRFSVVFPELRAISTTPIVPTVVLSADRKVISAADIASGQLPPFVDQAFADALWAAQLAAQDELAATFPGATHITSTNSGHYIHVEQPQVVVQAIREVLSRARATPRPS